MHIDLVYTRISRGQYHKQFQYADHHLSLSVLLIACCLLVLNNISFDFSDLIMSNLFNIPFSFSVNPQTLKNLLQYRKNIQPNSSDDKWSEKAIKGLIKRLTKASMIDDLQAALDSQNPQTRCVTIPR